MPLILPSENRPIQTKIIIQDDFMPEDYPEFVIHQMTDISSYFPWYWGEVLPEQFNSPDIERTAPKNRNWQFSHVFWLYNKENSNYAHLIQPLIDKIDPDVFYRIKANINPWEESPVQHGWHIDENYPGVTSIYYANTNNGKTTFRMLNEEGEYEYTEVESKRNRLVTFDNRISHSGCNQTDTQFRLLFNINYYKHSFFEYN